MRFLAVILCLVAWSVRASTNVVDMFTSFENGNAGDLVTSNLLAQSSATNGSLGYWLVSTNSILTITNLNDATLRGPVIVNGTPYIGSGHTKTLACDNKQDLNRQYAKFTFASDKNQLSVGFAFKWITGGTFNLFDCFALEAASGEFMVLSVEDRTAGTSRLGLETQECPSGSGYIAFSDDQHYWVTMLWDKANLNAKMGVYDMSTWRCLYITNCSLANVACRSIWLGRYDAHVNGASAIMYYDDLLVDTAATFPLLPIGATVTASSTSRTAFDQAYTNAVSGTGKDINDIILLPTGSNEWTSTYVVSKTLTISGSGSNGNQTVVQLGSTGDTQDAIWDLRKDYCTVSNLQARSTSDINGWLIIGRSNWCRIRDVHFVNGLSATIQYGFGLVYNCSFLNCTRMGRAFAVDSGNRMSAYGLPYDITIFGRTNWSVWENNIVSWDSSYAATFPLVLSSQEGALWIVRHCSITNNKSFSPAWDAHGGLDPSTAGVIAFQVYSNRVGIAGATKDKFVDHRGGMALVYSNVADQTWTSDYNLRADDDNPSSYYTPGPQVTNSFYWENYENVSTPMQFAVEANDVSVITTNQSYFGRAPATLYQVQYPHFLREGVTHDPNASGAVFGAVSIPGPGRPRKGSLF